MLVDHLQDKVTPEQVTAFLDRPLVAVVSTLRPDGSPHAVPVWYRYDGASFYVWTGLERLWVRNIRSDSRVAISVHEIEPPFQAYVGSGTALVESADQVTISAEIERIARRYIPGSEVDAYIESYKTLRAIVVIHPRGERSWGEGY